MAVKTWASGEVLTASDLNTYAGNPGLVYVTQQTIGNAVSSVTVSNCFSATYDNYRIIVEGGVASTNVWLRLQLGSITTNYYGAFTGTNYTTTTYAGQNDNNGALFNYIGFGAANALTAIIDITSPFKSLRKFVSASNVFLSASNAYGTYTGELANATSASGFTLSPNTGTITGGTIRVYGYRQA